MTKRKLGDRINRGFVAVIIILGSIMIIRFAIAVVKYDVERIEWRESDFELSKDEFPEGNSNSFKVYPETQDDFAETAHALNIPLEWIDSTLIFILQEDSTGAFRAFLPLEDSLALKALYDRYSK